ncbi:MAG: DNA polymerase I [Bacilli bacterium]
MQKMIIIDGNSLLFRAYYATAYGDKSAIMRTKDGTPTNAIFAFANMLAKMLQSFKGGESIVIAFDTDKDTFRKEELASYKANRAPCPEELKRQFPLSRELCGALNIMCYEQHGVEADDIAGTIAKMASKENDDVTLYTSDKDYLQLIDKNVKVSLLKVGLSNMELLDEAGMKAKFGFTPKQIIDYKGLRGDVSDNLPGIPGVGDKTAVKLIQEYGDFETILSKADDIGGKLGENLKAYAEQGRQCYRLATMKTDVELPFGLKDLVYEGYDFASVNAFAQKYELKQFLSRLPLALKKGATPTEEMTQKTIATFQGIPLASTLGLSLDIDFDDYHDAPLEGVAISSGDAVYYENIEDLKKDTTIQEILANPAIEKNVYDGKASIYALKRYGITLQGIKNDLLLAAYLLDSSVSSNPPLVYSSFGIDIVSAENDGGLLSSGHPLTAAKMAYFADHLVDKLTKSLQSVDAFKLYSEVEMPLMAVLAGMELEGFPLRADKLKEYGKDFERKKEKAAKEIYALAGREVNLNSPKQLGELLYGEMGLKGPKDGSTSIEVLSSLAEESPIIEKILTYRKYAKLMGTYIDGLLPHIKADGKIHSYFNQAQTSTGRLSSSSPNLQNISARDEEGKQIRNAFFYDDPAISMLSLDYGQIELRIMAALSHCQAYIDVFASDRDVHTETAKKIFHTDEVTPLMRRKAKAVNFAIIYGTTDFGLAEQIGGTRQEARDIIRNFYLSYPEVGAFLNETTHDAETKGYVTTMFGRRRYLREVNDPNYAKREAARRAALNAPVQGSAADLIKLAMVNIAQFLKEGHYQSKMVLQIHDELIFAGPEDELKMLEPKLEELMTHAVSLPVKLTVEAGLGKSWYSAKD